MRRLERWVEGRYKTAVRVTHDDRPVLRNRDVFVRLAIRQQYDRALVLI